MSFQMDHEIHQGDTFSFEMAYYEDDDVTPIDITLSIFVATALSCSGLSSPS